MRVIRTLLASSMLAGLIAVAPVAIGTPVPVANKTPNGCDMPQLAQNIAGQATKAVKQPNGAVRFYLPTAEAQSIGMLAVANAKSFNHFEASKYWYFRTQTWIEWLESDPCEGQDGYAFGFTVRCYNSPNSSGSPQTPVACNHYHHAALEYDLFAGAHDWDPVWGHKFYNPQNQSSCTDAGGPGRYHFFSDVAPGELRTWLRVKVTFVAINHPAFPKKTTSRHLQINGHSTHGGEGVGALLDTTSPPGGASDGEC